jgi:hypothetical protein
MLVNKYRSGLKSSASLTSRKTKKSIRHSSTTLSAPKEDLILKNYNELLNDQIREYPFKSFIIDAYQYGYRYNFHDSRTFIDEFAKGILSTVPYGAIVSALPLNLENTFIQIATARASRQSVFFDSVITAEKLGEQFQNVDPGTFICKPTQGNRIQLPELKKFFPWMTRVNQEEDSENFLDRRFPKMRHIFQMDKNHYPNTRYLRSLMEKGSENDVLKRVVKQGALGVKDIATYVKQGAKNIGLSQYNIINTGYFVGKGIGLTSEDIILTTIPHSLSAGLSLGVGMALSHKSQLTYAFPEFNATATLEVMTEEFVTTLIILPEHLDILLKTTAKKVPKKFEKSFGSFYS